MERQDLPISTEALAELRLILREEYPSTEFSDEELRELAHRLFTVIGNVYRQLPATQGAARGSVSDSSE